MTIYVDVQQVAAQEFNLVGASEPLPDRITATSLAELLQKLAQQTGEEVLPVFPARTVELK